MSNRIHGPGVVVRGFTLLEVLVVLSVSLLMSALGLQIGRAHV